MLLYTTHIDEAQVDELDLVVLDQLSTFSTDIGRNLRQELSGSWAGLQQGPCQALALHKPLILLTSLATVKSVLHY
ncbi:hypothetical protein GUG62_20745 [Xanthomonas citri pv. citri]|nr:hypothetical protein [Xanthomonas citri pv. citri]MBD1535270.1 hypothetical protein [Xanthomonas citri pv. citri]